MTGQASGIRDPEADSIIPSDNLPLSTTYTILEGPIGDRRTQGLVSGTILYSVDTREIIGRCELSGYDSQGNG